MEILRAADHEGASQMAATLMADAIAEKPTATVLVATGNTPIRAYEILADRVDGSGITAFQLDEYVGVPEDDPRSLFEWMRKAFLDPLQIPASQVRKFDSCAPDLEAECRGYDAEVASLGGFDLCILGLGPNGHLGFNEPPSRPDSPTRVVDLTPESLASNAAYWSQAVPDRALTVGMAPILASRTILLLATGARKHRILTEALEGPITPDLPASLLRLATGRVTVVADRAALEGEA